MASKAYCLDTSVLIGKPDCLESFAADNNDVYIPWMVRTELDKFKEDVYSQMWGPSEWLITGNLKDWDVAVRPTSLRMPALVLAGRFDHATPVLAETLHDGIPGSKIVIFQDSGHFPHLEETARYLQVIGDFLSGVEAGPPDRSGLHH